MVSIVDNSPKPVGFYMMNNSSLGATCPTCSKDMLVQDGLTSQEALHVLYGEQYDQVSFWPVRSDGTTTGRVVCRIPFDAITRGIERYEQEGEGVEKTADGAVLIVPETNTLEAYPPPNMWYARFIPAPTRGELVTAIDTTNNARDVRLQLYYVDHTVDKYDRARLSTYMMSKGYENGIEEPEAIYDQYEDCDEDTDLACSLCNKVLLLSQKKRDTEELMQPGDTFRLTFAARCHYEELGFNYQNTTFTVERFINTDDASNPHGHPLYDPATGVSAYLAKDNMIFYANQIDNNTIKH